jgi:acyl-CoA thioester hydrolase
MADPFSHRFRVRYSEVDPQAVVFNSRYLEYADVVVSEFFRARRAEGMPDIEFHIRKAEVDYLRPIRLEELVEGRLTVLRIGNSSMQMRIELHGAGEASGENDLRAEIALVQVHIALDSGESRRIPDSVRQAFGPYIAESAEETVDA